MHDPKHFVRFFEVHDWIFENHLGDVTHEESCLVPSTGGNSLNWILGHVVASRNDILALLGGPPIWSPEQAAPYVRGTDGRSDAFTPLPLEEIRDALGRSSAAIRSNVESMSPADFEKPTEKATVGADLAFLQFHESYHAGQTGILRRLLGKEGAIR